MTSVLQQLEFSPVFSGPADHVLLFQYREAPAFHMDLSLVKFRLMTKLKWTEERTELALLEYRRFFHLMANYQGGFVPNSEIDEVWHAHILHTALYAEHCEKVSGRFIHHRPSEGTPSGHTLMKRGYEFTLKKYLEVFGVCPDPLIWKTVSSDENCTNGCQNGCNGIGGCSGSGGCHGTCGM